MFVSINYKAKCFIIKGHGYPKNELVYTHDPLKSHFEIVFQWIRSQQFCAEWRLSVCIITILYKLESPETVWAFLFIFKVFVY